MKKILEAATEVARSTVLDGNISAADLRDNKKKVAIDLAKSVVWTLVQNHPLYIATKLALWGLAALGVLIIGLVGYFMVF